MCKLSVIMSTYKEPEHYLRLAIDSILNQTMTDFEFIIVLDYPENTMIESLILEYAAKDPRVVFVKNEKNLGLVGALNHALQHVRGEYVARMDADDIAEPDRFEKELQTMEAEQLDIVGALTKRIDEDGNPLPGISTRYYSPRVVMESLSVTDCVPHPTWLVKREVYEVLNGYRQIDRCEDYDFLLRAKKQGYRIGLCDAYLLNYRITGTGISQSSLLEQRLTAKYIAKHYERLDEVEMGEIRKHVHEKLNPTVRANYSKADALFIKARNSRRNPAKMGILLLASILTSRYQALRILDMLKLRSIRKSK